MGEDVSHALNTMLFMPTLQTGQFVYDLYPAATNPYYQPCNPYLRNYLNGTTDWRNAWLDITGDGIATATWAYPIARGGVSLAGQSAWRRLVLEPPTGSFRPPSVPYPSAWRETLLPEAEAARDALANQLGRERSMYIGAIDKYGRVITGHSQPGACGGNMCAETAAFNQGGTWFTYPVAVRGPRGGTIRPGEVCPRCQWTYPPTAFPPNVPRAPGGAWPELP